jgi:hypothetical protein
MFMPFGFIAPQILNYLANRSTNNSKKKKDKKTNNDIQNTMQKIKD